MPPPFDMISKMHPPREAWRLKVRVLRLCVVPSFGNHEVPNSMEMILLDEHCGKIQATVKKPLLNRFRDHIVEGQVLEWHTLLLCQIMVVIEQLLMNSNWFSFTESLL
ncbi:hypothetical protein AHAS_Ahas16G0259900 [Arachis hypogaea]